MKKITNRLKNVTQFYAGNIRREAAKEMQIVRGLRTKRPLVSYMGWTGYHNLGDEILYEAHLALFPRLAMVPFRKSPLVAASEMARGRTAYKGGFLGGGTLINQSDSWLNRIAYLQAKHIPMYCLGTGVTEDSFQALHERTNMDEWVKVLDTFAFVGIRGPYSARLLKNAGFKKCTITGDTALALANPTFEPRKPQKVVGINYGLVKENRIWGDTTTYTKNMVAIIKQLIAQGYAVRLLPVWDKDIASNRHLLQLVDDRRCTLHHAFDSLAAYKNALQPCRLFIGQKLHATIMACMERIPSLMIEYNPKCRDFMASIAMERYVLKTSQCQPQKILAKLHDLEAEYAAIQKILNKHILYYRDLQYKRAKEIEDKLLASTLDH